MKTLIFILSFVFFGCSSSIYIKEDVRVKTRVYTGEFVQTVVIDEKYSYVYTSQAAFKVKGHPKVLEGVCCYVRIEPCRQDVTRDIAKRLEVWYFTWDGADQEYKIKK